jgi:hypothetical protein
MKRTAFWIVALGGWAVGQANVGKRLPSAMIPKNNATVTIVCASSPSQFYPCIRNVQISGVRFTEVGYDSRTHQIKYLRTQDETFKTADGLHVNGVITLAENEVFAVRGWGVIGPRTSDGWRPILRTDLVAEVVNSIDGDTVDLKKPVTGKMHRFKIIAFDKGGV